MEEWGNDRSINEQIGAWEQELATWEQQIGRIRARQVELIRHLDRYQIDTADGARTMGDWARFFTPTPSP